MLPLISTDQLDVVDVIQGQVKNSRFSRFLALYSEDWKWWCQQQLGQKEGAMQDETITQSMEAVPRWPLDVRRFEKIHMTIRREIWHWVHGEVGQADIQC